MTPKELAHEFWLSIPAALTDPNISLVAHEAGWASKIQAAVDEARAETWEEAAKLAMGMIDTAEATGSKLDEYDAHGLVQTALRIQSACREKAKGAR